MGEALGRAGVNIDGFFGFSLNNMSWTHLLVTDAAGARSALDGVADVAEELEVLVLDVDDHVGALGEVTRRLSDAGVNLRLAYLGTGTRLVLAPDDVDLARRTLSGTAGES
ncbi:MAG: hypothetical protein QOE92_2642 [Chloroflexota bacterium]|nr:hypothetical protein [Chloroflexota bacterium]